MKLKQIPSNTVVHTPTEEEAKELLAILHENGYRWCGGKAPIKKFEWDVYVVSPSLYVNFGNIHKYNHGNKPITLAEFKERYLIPPNSGELELQPAEKEPQPKFKVGDCVSIRWINKWGRITNVHFSEEAEEWEYNGKPKRGCPLRPSLFDPLC